VKLWIRCFQGLMSRGGTSAGGVTGGVTGSELARFVSKHVSVKDITVFPPSRISSRILRNGWPMGSRRGAVVQQRVQNKG